MDFLGHIYFSNNDIKLMYANLFGDFVKGKDFSMYTAKIQKGITLHRHLDNHIDHHPIVLELTRFLYPKLPKVSAIAVDIYFDHLLAKNWRQFHPLKLDDFLNDFESYPISLGEFNNTDFETIIQRMNKGKWLHHSATHYGLEKSLNGVSTLLSFPNKLTNAFGTFIENEIYISEIFFAYMKEAIPYFSAYHQYNEQKSQLE